MDAGDKGQILRVTCTFTLYVIETVIEFCDCKLIVIV